MHTGLLPAEAGPTKHRVHPGNWPCRIPCGTRKCLSRWVHAVHGGTGFSREEAGMYNTRFAARHPTPSRLKPVPQVMRHGQFPGCTRCICRTGFSREGAGMYNTRFSARHPTHSRRKPVPLGHTHVRRIVRTFHGWLSRPKVYIEFKIQ